MSKRVKDLHLFQNLEELRSKSFIGGVEKTSAKLLLKSSVKLYGLAEKSLLDGDEELAYLYFFRFCDAVTTAKKKDDYLKDPSLKTLISDSQVYRAITNLEKLGESLAKRYALKKEVEKARSVAREIFGGFKE